MQPKSLQAFVVVAGKVQPWNGVDATVIAGGLSTDARVLYRFDSATQTWVPYAP